MAAASGPTDDALIRALEEEPHSFSFFQAVRLLEQAAPDAVRVGQLGPARDEAVRLRPSSSLAFQAADVTEVARRKGAAAKHLLTTTVLGLYGANSPLPTFYSEAILKLELRDDEPDPARLFLDVFNHRLLSLLYAAWAKYRWEFTFEPGAVDRTSQRMMGLVGLATDGLQRAVQLPAGRLLRYAGTLSLRPRGASAVACVVSDYFDGVPVCIEQCLPRWVPVDPIDRNRVGAENATLGADLTVGESVLDRMGKCRVVIGPMNLATYESFLPEGPAAQPLAALLRVLLQDPQVYDLRLVVLGPEVPWLRLCSDDGAARLGWTSWIRHDPASPDKGERFHATPLRRAA